MNLIDHVLNIRLLIHRALDGKFERLGIMPTGYEDRPSLNKEDLALRNRLQNINDSHLAEKDDFSEARDYTLKQCVFTLFNRLAAIKLMEQKELFPEVIKQRSENGGLSAAHQAWLEEHPEGHSMDRDGIVPFLLDKFDEMVEMNFLIYQTDYPYAIMPTADELNEIIQAFNEIENDPDCAETWQNDDILGWLYENFNTVEKVDFKESGEKVEYDKVSLQSQIYTPSWVVKFLVDNTLGKLYLEMYPESDIDKADFDGNRKYPIANRPQTQQRRPKDLRQLKVLDPACGSGNFLLYTFSLLYDLYIDQIENFGAEYSRREIPSLIVENNLYGVDLDERAVQLAQIGLLIKARELAGRRARMPKHTNVVCTNFELPTFDIVEKYFGYDASWESKYNDVARKVWTDLADARKFGSLVRVEELLKEIEPNDENHGFFSAEEMGDLFAESNKIKTVVHNLVNKYSEQNHNQYSLLKMSEAMAFLDLISNQFDVALANPPYTPSDKYGIELKRFVDGNYFTPVKARENLYTCFLLRLTELLGDNGHLGIICPQTFMFIDSFKGVRKHLLDNLCFNVFVQFGFGGIFKESVDPVFFSAKKTKEIAKTVAFKYDNIFNNSKIEKFSHDLKEYINNKSTNESVYISNFKEFKELKSYPFLFWLSEDFRGKFKLDLMADFADVKQGIATGNNYKFCRYWWEVKGSSQEYYPYAKGGAFNRWSGNLWLNINWEKESIEAIKKDGRLQNQQFYFSEGITYSASGRGGYAFRYLPPKCLFDVGGSSIFLSESNISIYYLLSLLNSKLCYYIADSLNPTANIQVGDLRRMPIALPDSSTEANIEFIAHECVRLSDIKRSSSLIEDNYSGSPITCNNDVQTVIKQFYDSENFISTVILLYESLIDSLVFDIYELSPDDRKVVIKKEGELFSDLPLSSEAKHTFLEKLDPEKDKLLFEFVDKLKTTTGINALHDYEKLYQSSYSWEEFCDKNRLNPIEVWFQCSKISCLPSQRTQKLAFELITDVIRSIMSQDDDGVIPLTTNAGETNMAPRIEAEMIERGYRPAQIAQIFSLLGGGNLECYLQERFFQQLSDHLNLFMYLPKTPFIWHITSGEHHALELYVSIYKWKRDTLIRIKSVYAANRETALNDRLQVLIQGDATQRAEAAEVRAQLQELSEFCGKIDELLSSGYDPKLDDGVGKNIAPLQKVGIISYKVLKDKQLEKYLNADW